MIGCASPRREQCVPHLLLSGVWPHLGTVPGVEWQPCWLEARTPRLHEPQRFSTQDLALLALSFPRCFCCCSQPRASFPSRHNVHCLPPPLPPASLPLGLQVSQGLELLLRWRRWDYRPLQSCPVSSSDRDRKSGALPPCTEWGTPQPCVC